MSTNLNVHDVTRVEVEQVTSLHNNGKWTVINIYTRGFEEPEQRFEITLFVRGAGSHAEILNLPDRGPNGV